MTSRPDNLRAVLDSFTLGEVVGWDLCLAIAAGIGGVWLGVEHFDVASASAGTVANLVGVVVGAVVAALAIIAAFMSGELLRKFELLEKDPINYLGPFLFTAVLGIAAGLALIVLAATPVTSPVGVRGTVAGLAGGLSVWTLTSLICSLATLVQFVRLQAEAAQLTEEEIAAFKKRDDN